MGRKEGRKRQRGQRVYQTPARLSTPPRLANEHKDKENVANKKRGGGWGEEGEE